MVSGLIMAAGGLFLVFALVEWALYRMEQVEASQSRFRTFGSVGGALLLVGGVATAWRHPATPAAATQNPVAVITSTVRAELDLVTALLQRTESPTLAQVRREREHLLEARRRLASLPRPGGDLDRLINQGDTLFGVASTALATQWQNVKASNWSDATRAKSLSSLGHEWERWLLLRRCAEGEVALCPLARTVPPEATAMKEWHRWFHAYLLDLNRFSVDDPDLVVNSPTEMARLHKRLEKGMAELVEQPATKEFQAIQQAVGELFATAEHALTEEERALATGIWDAQRLTQIYTPVRTAWENYFKTALCSSNSPACMGPGGA